VTVIESPLNHTETRVERGRRLRKQRRWRQGMVLLTGLSAFSVTLLTGSILMEPTYSQFTSQAVIKGSFAAKAQFCGKDTDDDHDDHDEKGRKVEDTNKKGDKHKPRPPGDGKGHCKPHDEDDDKEHDLQDEKQADDPKTAPAIDPAQSSPAPPATEPAQQPPAARPEEQPQPELPVGSEPSGNSTTPASQADGGGHEPDASPSGDSMIAPTQQDAPPPQTPPDQKP
jgi:hypothetical protein